MHDGPVVSNNTPLVALWTVGQLPLLRDLFGTVLIPTAVRDEFLAKGGSSRQSTLKEASSWLETVEVRALRRALSYVGLDRGESEVLALAEERNARLVIVDELRARRYARRLQFPLTGTVGVLLLAKEAGLIAAITPVLRQLRESGLFLSDDLCHTAIRLAGEA